MKVLITGAHFTPAQAVIEELKKDPEVEIIYIGRKFTLEGDKSQSVESQILPKLGIKFLPLVTGRLQRVLTIHTIPSLLKIPFGFFQAFYLLLKEKPDVILSFGGYVAVPVIFSGWLLSVPIIIHEQTLVSGLANTISSWFADKIAVSFPDHQFPKTKRVVLTGNPMRQEILKISEDKLEAGYKQIINRSRQAHLPVILITGGNQGSHIINQAAGEVLDKLTEETFVIHQTGNSKFQDFEGLSERQKTLKYPERYLVTKWIKGQNMGAIIKNSQLVVTRAGMNILLELAVIGTPALVIPLPYLHKNEQNINAKFFADLGLVEILPQGELSGINLLSKIKKMLKMLPELKEKAAQAQNVVVPDAAKRLALEVQVLSKNK